MVPILLIHGFPFDCHMFDSTAAFLRSADGGKREVIVPDLAGFGDSPEKAPAKDAASMEGYAQSIFRLIQKHGGKAIVGGFSMGGYVLLALLREHSEAVAGAMLMDTRPDADGAETRATRLKMVEDLEKDAAAARPKAFDALLGKVLGKRPTDAVKKQTREQMERQPTEAIIAAQSAMARRRDQSDLLPELKIPVLIVVGAEDSITPPSVAINMQTLMPHAMLVQIVASGHMTPLEQPAAVNSAIKGFLMTMK